MACLDRRLAEIEAAISVLSTDDAEVIERASTIVAQLPALDECADTTTLLADPPVPRDPGVRADIEATENRLAQARALLAAARHDEAMRIVEEIEQRRVAQLYGPLHAKVLYLRGQVYRDTGDPLAERALRRGLDRRGPSPGSARQWVLARACARTTSSAISSGSTVVRRRTRRLCIAVHSRSDARTLGPDNVRTALYERALADALRAASAASPGPLSTCRATQTLEANLEENHRTSFACGLRRQQRLPKQADLAEVDAFAFAGTTSPLAAAGVCLEEGSPSASPVHVGIRGRELRSSPDGRCRPQGRWSVGASWCRRPRA